MTPPSVESLVALAVQYVGGKPGVYVWPHILPRKEKNARTVHEESLTRDEPIVVLFDDTVFGSGDDGYIITPERICWRNYTEAPRGARVRVRPSRPGSPCGRAALDGGFPPSPRSRWEVRRSRTFPIDWIGQASCATRCTFEQRPSRRAFVPNRVHNRTRPGALALMRSVTHGLGGR